VTSPLDAKLATALGGRSAAAFERAFGHRTIFFRDPDGNVIEIYAEI